VERHYCYSCRDHHAFLDAAEWAHVEPLWRRGQTAAAREGRIARRLKRPVPNADWMLCFQAALDKYTEITGDLIDNPHSLYHRQLRHECKWVPRRDDPPPPGQHGSRVGAA
jgi:hypothetical protein